MLVPGCGVQASNDAIFTWSHQLLFLTSLLNEALTVLFILLFFNTEMEEAGETVRKGEMQMDLEMIER